VRSLIHLQLIKLSNAVVNIKERGIVFFSLIQIKEKEYRYKMCLRKKKKLISSILSTYKNYHFSKLKFIDKKNRREGDV